MVTYKLLPLESGSSQSVVEDKLAKQDSGGQVLQPSRKGGARRRLRLRRNLVNPHSVVKEKFTKQGSGGQILQPSLEDVASRRSRPRVPKKTPKSSENCYPGSTEVVLSPPSILAQWLDIDDIAERESYWLKFRKYAKLNKMDSTLPIILLQYIAKTTRPDVSYLLVPKCSMLIVRKAILDDLGQELWNRAMSTLRNAGFNTDDVAKWAWVVSPHDGEEMATRFLFLPLKNPPLFLLLHILRKDISRVKTLKKLLIYIWKHIMGKSSAYDDPLSGQEISVGSPSPAVMQALSIYTESEPDAPILKETEYTVMITRLLRQCRRLWPAAVLSVSYAVGPIMDSILAESSGDPKNLDRRMHRKLCHLFNYTLTRLSLPAATEPMKSMAHNWQAQKVLLNLAGQFQPPLFLNGSAYRAVVRVLAAQKKTEREAMVSNRRSRSWPPWRIEQDGMDTCRELADDLSRSVLAAMRMTESGYREDDRVRALKILGGQESDGTPTIQTRKLPGPWNRMQEWAARIEATRDVEEAWSAFVNFRQQQGKPSLSMYFAMIQKLQHEIARTRRGVEYDASPGDGREVLPPSHDNFSTFYCRQLQPPSVKELYKQMITESHQRPTGRFLSYMVSNARTPQEGLWYLQRSNISNEAIQFLRTGRGDVPNLVEQLNDDIFAAFIKLLCRFALRSEASNQSRDFKDFFVNPLLHCHQILKRSQIRFRPAWYELFEGLSRRDIIVDRDIDDRFQNDIFSWQVTAAALDDFHQLGLELDHRGFQIICRGFEKAAVASSHPGYEQLFAQSQIRILKERFAEISEALPWGCEYGIPRLLFPIGGAHLHPYVRVLGVIKDYDEIIHLLEWMVENHKPLNDSVSQSRNNAKMVRNTIVAMKVFLNDTEFENRAQELVERVEAWDGWPSDREVQAYLSKNTATYAGNNFEEEEFDQEEDLKPSKEAGAES